MKVSYNILLAFLGLASAMNLPTEEGSYSVTLNAAGEVQTIVKYDSLNTTQPVEDYSAQRGECVPGLTNRVKITCHNSDFPDADYDAARDKFVKWIETSPSHGWFKNHEIRYSIVNEVAVGACSKARFWKNPTCAAELDASMHRIQDTCGHSSAGIANIKKWRKKYFRLDRNVIPIIAHDDLC